MNNPSKYDDACTIARMMCNAEAAFLIILNGAQGQGFSVQCPPEMVKDIPRILRTIADAVEKDPDDKVTHIIDLMKSYTKEKRK